MHGQKSPLGLPPEPERAAELAQRIQPGLDWVNTLLADGRPFLSGQAPSTADCTLAAFLQFMRFTDTDLLGSRTELRRWDEAYRSRDTVRDLFMM